MDHENSDNGFHEPEVAHRLVYLVDENRWERTETLVAVGKKMFAWGERQGCILVEDKTDGHVNVVKKDFDQEGPTSDLYDSIKIEAIAAMMADCFNQLDPPMKVKFMPCFLYILAQRPNQPTVRVEPLIFHHDKAKIRAIPDLSELERDTLSAFELFTYHGSKKAFVITNPSRVGDMWTEPEMHSVDRTLGGARNMGARGINVFLLRHEYSPVAAELGLPNPANLHARLAADAVQNPEDWGAADPDLESAQRNYEYVRLKLVELGSLAAPRDEDAVRPCPRARLRQARARGCSGSGRAGPRSRGGGRQGAPRYLPELERVASACSGRSGSAIVGAAPPEERTPEEAEGERGEAPAAAAPAPAAAAGATRGEAVETYTGLVIEERGALVYVAGKLPGTPAATAPIASGDHLVTVDGHPVYGMPLREARAPWVTGRGGGQIKELMSGPEGTSVYLQLKVPGEKGVYSCSITQAAGTVVREQNVFVPLAGHELPPADPGAGADAPAESRTTSAAASRRDPAQPRAPPEPLKVAQRAAEVKLAEHHRRSAAAGLRPEDVFPERLGAEEPGRGTGRAPKDEEYHGKESRVVGWHLHPKVGLSVSLIEDLMGKGVGIVSAVNEQRRYVSVRWSNSTASRCVYTGGGGVYELRAEEGQAAEAEKPRAPPPLEAMSHRTWLSEQELASGVKGMVLADIDEANTLAKLAPLAERFAQTCQFVAHLETQHAHQGYTMVATVRGARHADVDKALDAAADALGDHLFAVHRPALPDTLDGA